MLNIFICDDEQIQREYMSNCISLHINSLNQDISAKGCWGEPHELLNAVQAQSDNDIGLYFLDIDLGSDIDGIQLASEIRKIDPRGFIVIVTTHSEMLPKTFEYMIEPLGYIVKDSPDDLKEQIVSCLDNAISKYEVLKKNLSPKELITLSSGSKDYYIVGNDVYYITMSFIPHIIEVATTSSILQFRNTLSSVSKLLPDYFVQISRDTIINIRKVKEFNKASNKITLLNNLSFNCSTRKTNYIAKFLAKEVSQH